MNYEEVLATNNDSEIFVGLVGAIGIDLDNIYKIIEQKLKAFEYKAKHIKISKDIIAELFPFEGKENEEYSRITHFMDKGNLLRENFNGALAIGAAAKISQERNTELSQENSTDNHRYAYIINSLKHPEEVQLLRKIYSHGFFLISVFSSEERRLTHLKDTKHINEDNASILIQRDADESIRHGQHTADTFHLSDFFINTDGDSDKLNHDIWRIIDLIFGNPYITPTFQEYAMYMAFSASLRSADLSRQVGAVVTRDSNILSTGANDIPKAGGGLYWPRLNSETKKIEDLPEGRDYIRGEDSNVVEKAKIISDILDTLPDSVKSKLDSPEVDALRAHLSKSKIKDITEYGRVVHAEMEALLGCARNNISTLQATLYCTTFPCHNCAKHIIASGVEKVIYIEPYPKSKAISFHSDSISIGHSSDDSLVKFEAFTGVGPRSFFNLFSTNLGSGYAIKRKDENGKTLEWKREKASVRMPLLAVSYIDREKAVAADMKILVEKVLQE